MWKFFKGESLSERVWNSLLKPFPDRKWYSLRMLRVHRMLNTQSIQQKNTQQWILASPRWRTQLCRQPLDASSPPKTTMQSDQKEAIKKPSYKLSKCHPNENQPPHSISGLSTISYVSLIENGQSRLRTLLLFAFCVYAFPIGNVSLCKILHY